MSLIRCILFDLDGVLIDSRVLHYETFCEAIQAVKPNFQLTWREHEERFDGLSTKEKLRRLVEETILSEEDIPKIFNKKQELTLERLPNYVRPRENLKQMLRALKSENLLLGCATNAIRATLEAGLTLMEVKQYFDILLANEDIQNQKPHPDIYKKAMTHLGVHPNETLILEDSPIGRQAAHASGAHVLEVQDVEDTTLSLIRNTIQNISLQSKKPAEVWNIVIPMAGEGSRFQKAGFQQPKPFIPIHGKPMIHWVIENMIPKIPTINLHFHFIVRRSHCPFFNFPKNIQYQLHYADTPTEGAACSVLLAKEAINNGQPLIIVNSDQYLEWKPEVFYKCMENPEYDGCILTFWQPDPEDKKWSYAQTDNENLVERVAEKEWISPYATVGLYGWKRGADFVKYAESMIEKNRRVNNEFYVCPVYNEAIQDGKKFRVKLCRGMWGLGIPEDLQKFVENYLPNL